jgi:large subunit ribosomal protein L13
METKIHKIDAEGKILGKLAVEIAVLIRGKDKPNYVPNKDMGDDVIVKNADKLKVTGKKLSDKIYYSHSGYLGGLKQAPLERLMAKRPNEALRRAVEGMLPKNKLAQEQIKRLKFE